MEQERTKKKENKQHQAATRYERPAQRHLPYPHWQYDTEVGIGVRQHKHLPGVPTEKNIENNGLDVAAATKAQMEKIEDLYLYVMQQQKEITQLKAANKRLQKEIEK